MTDHRKRAEDALLLDRVPRQPSGMQTGDMIQVGLRDWHRLLRLARALANGSVEREIAEPLQAEIARLRDEVSTRGGCNMDLREALEQLTAEALQAAHGLDIAHFDSSKLRAAVKRANRRWTAQAIALVRALASQEEKP